MVGEKKEALHLLLQALSIRKLIVQSFRTNTTCGEDTVLRATVLSCIAEAAVEATEEGPQVEGAKGTGGESSMVGER